VTGVVHEVFEVVSVIESQFLAARYRSPGKNPNLLPIVQLGFTVRIAAVIDQPSRIPADSSVHILPFIQRKDVGVLLETQVGRLLFGNSSPDVLDQPHSGGDIAACEQSSAMDA